MFELVTALHLDPPDRAAGRAAIPLSRWLADHFPDTPLVPGTVLLELAAQIAGPLAESPRTGTAPGTGTVYPFPDVSPRTGTSRGTGTVYPHPSPGTGTRYSCRGAVLGMVRSAVFRAPVAVPAEVAIGATIVRREESSVVARVEVRHGGGLAMTAELVFAMIDVEDGPAWHARMARIARWEAAW